MSAIKKIRSTFRFFIRDECHLSHTAGFFIEDNGVTMADKVPLLDYVTASEVDAYDPNFFIADKLLDGRNLTKS